MHKRKIDWNIAIKLYEENKSTREVAKILNCSPPAIKNILTKSNIVVRSHKEMTSRIDLDNILISKEYNIGYTMTELANKYSCAYTTIRNILKRNNIKIRTKSESLKGKYCGEKTSNWKGGITLNNHNYRNKWKYARFRKKCLNRDKYTCQITKNKREKLNVHHLDSLNINKDKKYDVNNGITITEKLHKQFHKNYGYGNNNIKQFEEFKHKFFEVKDESNKHI